MQQAISNNIKQFRLILGLTMEDFGSRLGVSKSHISRIEGGIEPGAVLIERICEQYGIRPDRIYATDFLAPVRNTEGQIQ